MTEDERMKILGMLTQGGSVKIGQLSVGDHNTLNYHEGQKEAGNYNEEQIARAISLISGKDKPLALQKHYVGIICVLQSMGWPRKFATCCTRINALPGHELFPVKCDSNAIKSTQALKFASVDYKEWKNYEPKPGEENAVFRECKYAADSFYEALENLSNNG